MGEWEDRPSWYDRVPPPWKITADTTLQKAVRHVHQAFENGDRVEYSLRLDKLKEMTLEAIRERNDLRYKLGIIKSPYRSMGKFDQAVQDIQEAFSKREVNLHSELLEEFRALSSKIMKDRNGLRHALEEKNKRDGIYASNMDR